MSKKINKIFKKASSVGLSALAILALFGSGSYLYLSNQNLNASAAPVAGSTSLGGANSVGINKVYVSGTGESENLTVAPNGTVTVRVKYDNTGTQSVTDASIKDSLPAGFSYVADSIKNCIVPSATEEVCDTANSAQKNSMFSNLTGAGMSPIAGLYDNFSPVLNGGTGSGDNAGLLEIGKKRYIQYQGLENCSQSGAFVNRVNIESDNVFRPFTWVPIANFPCLIPGGTGYIQRDSVDTLGKRYIQSINGEFCNAGGPYYNRFALESDNTPRSYGFVPQAGYVCTDGSGNGVGGYHQMNSVDSLGKRYIQSTNSEFCYSPSFSFHNRAGIQADNTLRSYSFVPDPSSLCSNGIGTAGYFQMNSVDTLDNTRGKGYVEYQLTAPSPATTLVVSRNVSLSGGNFATANDSATLTVNVPVTLSLNVRALYPSKEPKNTKTNKYELWGIKSRYISITAYTSTTCNAQLYRSTGSVQNIVFQASNKYVFRINDNQPNGDADAYHVVSDCPISAGSDSDSDGSEDVAWLPTKELSSEYITTFATQYISIAAPSPSTTCQIFNPSGTLLQTLVSGSLVSPYPNRIFFGSSVGNTVVYPTSGHRIKCNKSVYAYHEKVSTDGFQSNINTHPQARIISENKAVLANWSNSIEEGLYYGDSTLWATRDIIFDSGVASGLQDWEAIKVNYSGSSVEFEIAGSNNCTTFGAFTPITATSNVFSLIPISTLTNQKCIKLRIKMRSSNGFQTPIILSAEAKWKSWKLVADIFSNPEIILPIGNYNSRLLKVQGTGLCKIAIENYPSTGTANWDVTQGNTAITSLVKPTTIGSILYSPNTFNCTTVHYINNSSNMSASQLSFVVQQQFGTIISQRIIKLKYQ